MEGSDLWPLTCCLRMRRQQSVKSNAIATAEITETQKTSTGARSPLPHVLYIIDHLIALGGGEGALFRIVRNLPRNRFRCSVVTFREQRAPSMADFPCALHVLPLRRTYDFNACVTARKLRRIIRDEHVDIVHTFFETAN